MNGSPVPSIEHLLNMKAVAEILGVSSRSVWRLIARGELPQPLRIGHAVRMPASEVHAYIDRLKESRPRAR